MPYGPPKYPFEARLAKAREEIDDALNLRLKPLGPVPNQQPMQIPGNPQLTPQGMSFSDQQQVGPGMLSGNAMVGPQGFGGASANYGVPLAGGQLNVGGSVSPGMDVGQLQAQYQRGPFSAGVQYQPGAGVSAGVQYRKQFQEGGLATSLRTNPADHARDVAFVASRDQALRDMAGKRPFARGGYAEGGDIVVTGRRPVLDPVYTFMEDRISGDGGGFTGGGGAGGGSAGTYDIGGLQAAINAAAQSASRAPAQAPKQPAGPSSPSVLDIGRVGGVMKPSYGGGQSDVMRVMDLERSVGRAPKGVGARLGIGFAEGGGAWTRKEGKNPEGGLNAVGRASLKAQGHDIKPPVSAKQAKKSPKAAARRRSFCARMSGMPGPMKDEKGRPTRKALSLRKWDC